MIGDSVCDDVTNNAACEYDGGDCCGETVNGQVAGHFYPRLFNPRLFNLILSYRVKGVGKFMV